LKTPKKEIFFSIIFSFPKLWNHHARNFDSVFTHANKFCSSLRQYSCFFLRVTNQPSCFCNRVRNKSIQHCVFSSSIRWFATTEDSKGNRPFSFPINCDSGCAPSLTTRFSTCLNHSSYSPTMHHLFKRAHKVSKPMSANTICVRVSDNCVCTLHGNHADYRSRSR
jgi:hypothetical protein